VAPNGAAGDNLGETVASDGVTIVAGASAQANGPATGQDGGVYVFKRPGLSWHSAVPVGELRATTPVDGDYLGDHTIAVTPTLVVAGAPDHNTYKGITYLWAPLGPVLSQVAQSHSTWALGSKPPVINPSHRIRGGTTFSFKLSEPATASLVFTEKVRRHHHVRLKKKGRIRFAAKAGVSKVHVDGPISGSTKLVPGKAIVRITAVNAYGATTTATLHFTVH